MTSIFFDDDSKSVFMYHRSCAKNCYFFQSSDKILYLNKQFKKKFCKQKLDFRVHNLVLNTQNLIFFSFLHIIKKCKEALKMPIYFAWHAFVCHDQGMIN